MEAVGARLGRSSSRYGPTAVFSGPVRRWKKRWVPISSVNSSNHNGNHSNGNNGSRLLLYKWTSLSQSSNGGKNLGKDESDVVVEESSRRKYRYVPIVVLEEQKKADSEEKIIVDDEAKTSQNDASQGATSKRDVSDQKPDINDVPMEETEAPDKDQSAPQDLNETSLDLSLGLKGHDEDHDPKPEGQSKAGE
ncbi:hypothetical protein GIB67_032795 [Kingdonia uniflora]|uniref:Uncharacterized protein n=1 Tax=Kingdonia uniflora TaxID=39325 RepID=A0A7J7MWV6_9MAGN|nr:hypothetical protein GIB67_032795 [Kingdonia uniflora]